MKGYRLVGGGRKHNKRVESDAEEDMFLQFVSAPPSSPTHGADPHDRADSDGREGGAQIEPRRSGRGNRGVQTTCQYEVYVSDLSLIKLTAPPRHFGDALMALAITSTYDVPPT